LALAEVELGEEAIAADSPPDAVKSSSIAYTPTTFVLDRARRIIPSRSHLSGPKKED